MTSVKDEDEPSTRQLQLVTASSFALPDGWSVEEKPRPFSNNCRPSRVDKYYIEPVTGLKFHSLVAVHRYISDGHIDTHATYYIEPGTGKRFCSLVAVERYLTEENEHTPLQALIPNKFMLSNGSGSRKKKIRSLKFVSKNSPYSNECNSTHNASRLNSYSAPSKHQSSLDKIISGETSRPSQLNISSPPAAHQQK